MQNSNTASQNHRALFVRRFPSPTGPAPVAPATINRDDKGHATLRATRLDKPLVIDDRLDDEVYVRVPGAGDFVQQLPREGQPATDARCDDSHPEREVATEMRRDDNNIAQNETGSFSRRARSASSGTSQWSKTTRTAAGTPSGTPGPLATRIIKWKNENDYLSAVPAAYGNGAVNWMSSGGTLVGVETPLQSMNPTGSVTGRSGRYSTGAPNIAPARTGTTVRLNWEYQPSSQFFVVYSDGRDTLGRGMPDLLNRSFAAKITRLLRF